MGKDLKQEMEELALEGLQRLKDAETEWVQWLSACDGEECDECLRHNETVVRLSEVTTPWHEGCTNEYCRCMLIASPPPKGHGET
jgi:D-arabinose 1-dehydrogenase-like Zn-dependent alcohol dehydrogenase